MATKVYAIVLTGNDMFCEYEVVYLIRKIPNSNLPIGAIGTVLIMHDKPHRAYEVEFLGRYGETLDIVTVVDQDIQSVNR